MDNIISVKTVPPEFDFAQEVIYPFPVQGESITYKRYTFDSISNTNSNISLNTPGLTSNVLSRNAFKSLKLRLQYTVTATGAAIGNLSHQSQFICPRRFPIASTVLSEDIQLNNFTTNLNLSQMVDPLTRYMKFEDYNQLVYATPTQPDDCQNYDSSMVLSANSPFNTSSTTREELMPRNSYPVNIIQNPVADGNPQTVIIEYTFFEPIMASPFQFGLNRTDKALAWISTFNYSLTFGNLLRAFSFMESAYTTSLGYTITNPICDIIDATLYLKWQTLPQGVSLPESIVYDYNRIDQYVQVIRDTVQIDQTKNVTFNSTNLRNVPSDIMVYISKTYNLKTQYDADCYQPINTATFGYGNRENQLANNTAFDYYRLMKENGLEAVNLSQSMMLYSATNKNVNSSAANENIYRFAAQPLKLKIVKDITANNDLVIGTNDDSSFTASLNYTNVSGKVLAANEYSLTVLTVTPMKFVMSYRDNPFISQILTTNESRMLPISNMFSSEMAQLEGSGLMIGGAMLGGSWWSKLKRGVKKAYNKTADIAKKGMRYVDKYDDILAPALGVVSPELLAGYEISKAAARSLKGSGMLTQAEKNKLLRQAQNNQRKLRG